MREWDSSLAQVILRGLSRASCLKHSSAACPGTLLSHPHHELTCPRPVIVCMPSLALKMGALRSEPGVAQFHLAACAES